MISVRPAVILLLALSPLMLSAAPPPTPLGMKDFLSIAGVQAPGSLDAFEAAWGPGKRSADRISWDNGPTVSKTAGGMLVDFSLTAGPFIAKHPDGPLSIWGMPCDQAAAVLDFTDTVSGYLSCKHYEPTGIYLDVTLMCAGGKVTTLAVMWVPYDPKTAISPLPADHC